MEETTKPRVYWRPTWLENQDPHDACWAVKVPGMDIGFDSWNEAFAYAFLTATVDKMGVQL